MYVTRTHPRGPRPRDMDRGAFYVYAGSQEPPCFNLFPVPHGEKVVLLRPHYPTCSIPDSAVVFSSLVLVRMMERVSGKGLETAIVRRRAERSIADVLEGAHETLDQLVFPGIFDAEPVGKHQFGTSWHYQAESPAGHVEQANMAVILSGG